MKIFLVFLALTKTLYAILDSKSECENTICTEPIRIIVAVDTSGTVGLSNFIIEQRALINLVDSLNIGKNGAGLGILQFSTKSTKIVDISFNSTILKKSIYSMIYNGGWTNTKSAIVMASNMGKNYWTNNTTNILLIITDGLPQLSENKIAKERELNKTIKAVNTFKEFNPQVDIISIAVGKYSNYIYTFFKTISDNRV